MKLLGDMHVPRGVVTWKFYIAAKLDYETIDLRDRIPSDIPSTSLVFKGDGTTSGYGYHFDNIEIVSVTIAITGSDEIKIRWRALDNSSAYRRYRGRKLESETLLGEGAIRQGRQW